MREAVAAALSRGASEGRSTAVLLVGLEDADGAARDGFGELMRRSVLRDDPVGRSGDAYAAVLQDIRSVDNAEAAARRIAVAGPARIGIAVAAPGEYGARRSAQPRRARAAGGPQPPGRGAVGLLRAGHDRDQPIDRTSRGGAVAQAVLRLGQILNLDTVAEGVESEAQARELTLLGCQKAQGFHFARPLSAFELQRWLPAGDLSRYEAEVRSPEV